tara:strand:+ start:380 stop:880 length:501 start_codon:yes stop_codon:yes gene_type:complete
MADTLTLTITENIDNAEGGFEYNYTTTETFADCEAYTSTQLSFVHTGFTQFAKFGSTLGMGIYKAAKVKYMRFANLDASNFVTIQLSDSTANKQANYKLLAGQVLYFTAVLGDCFVFDVNSSTTAAAADVVQGTSNVAGLTATADEVQIKADTGSVILDTIIVYDL